MATDNTTMTAMTIEEIREASISAIHKIFESENLSAENKDNALEFIINRAYIQGSINGSLIFINALKQKGDKNE